HRSFETGKATQAVLAVAGIMALQGGVSSWVACHRRHHRYSDSHGDPHTPVDHHQGRFGAVKALYYVHFSRLFMAEDTSVEHYAPDMLANPLIQAIDRWSALWIVL